METETQKSLAAKSRLQQVDVPAYTLEQALKVPLAILDNYAGEPTAPARVASAMGLLPISGQFRALTESANVYGLTEGSAQSTKIRPTLLAERIQRPASLNDGLDARREALLNAKVIRDFLRRYDGGVLPKDEVAENILNDMGVPLDRTANVLSLILQDAEAVGFLHRLDGRCRIDLSAPGETAESAMGGTGLAGNAYDVSHEILSRLQVAEPAGARVQRVCVDLHTATMTGPVGKLLALSGLEPEAIDANAAAQSLSRMRDCDAAIIQVRADEKLLNEDLEEQPRLDAETLLKVGAAMALFGERVVLLCPPGVEVPPPLAHLKAVVHGGEHLDGDATIALLEAIHGIKGK